MKSVMFAAALMLGTAAVAQTDMTDPVDTTMPDTAVPTDLSVTPDPALTPAAPAALPSTGSIQEPSNANPEHDARGVAVISDAATVPAGFNGTAAGTGVGGPYVDASTSPTAQPATESYPACSRTVTDNCLQTYERGRSPA